MQEISSHNHGFGSLKLSCSTADTEVVSGPQGLDMVPTAAMIVTALSAPDVKPEQYAIVVRDIPNVPEGMTRKEQVDSYLKLLYADEFYGSLVITDNKEEKKSCASAPLWYVTAEELDSLSSYMRGRLTLDKVNASTNDMAAYAEANAHLISAPRNKLAENALEKALVTQLNPTQSEFFYA